MIGIDLFSGAGGMSLGAHQAGVNVVLAVESDPFACKTYGLNFPNVHLFNKDIRKLKELPKSSVKEPKILFGGPPCQGFSTSNQRTRKSSNPNNWLFEEYIRIAKLWKPDWIVFENVKGILETEGGVFLDQVVQLLESMGYTLSYKILDAANHGVPQHRSRLFVIGSRHGIKSEFPLSNSTEIVTVRDAINDLPELENGASINTLKYFKPPQSAFAKLMRGDLKSSSNHLVTRNAKYVVTRYNHIPQGGNWENIPARLMKNYKDRTNCHTGIYHRLTESKPSIVIGNYRKNMLVHPKKNRGLSVREAARLQSFPDNFNFVGSIGFQQQQVGNAVPPLLAKAVFDVIVSSHR